MIKLYLKLLNLYIKHCYVLELQEEKQYNEAFDYNLIRIYNSKFPLSNEAVKSQMMMGFIEYIRSKL